MSKKFLLDMAERAVATFVQGFAASVVVTGSFTLLAVKIGVGAGVLAVLKAIAATKLGGSNSASLVQ